MTGRSILGFVFAAAMLLIGVAVSGAGLGGRVELLAKGGNKPARNAVVGDTVVYFTPRGSPQVQPSRQPVEMATRGKQFVPRVLVVTRGTTVRFPNQDPILHNVFSVTPGSQFDLGLYRRGEGKTWSFDKAGVVRVFCNVHHSMVASVLVLETPYFTTAGEDGGFRFEGLPDGVGTLSVWHEQAEPWSRHLRLPSSVPIVARLEITRPRVPPHLNKFGRPYGRKRQYR